MRLLPAERRALLTAIDIRLTHNLRKLEKMALETVRTKLEQPPPRRDLRPVARFKRLFRGNER